MLRAALTALFAVLLTSCAHERARDGGDPAAIATAQFIIQAIGSAQPEDYSWEGVAARTSVEWGPAGPGGEEGANVRRDARLRANGRRIIALGDNANVGSLSLDTNSLHALAVIDALRRAGADVSFQGDYESYSEHIVTPAGGDYALLTTNSTCILFEPQDGCRNYVTLTFVPGDPPR